jgi:hypothetical protein
LDSVSFCGRTIAFLDSMLFGHVLALFGLPVPTRTGLVINVSFCIYPQLAIASPRGKQQELRHWLLLEQEWLPPISDAVVSA